jgi:hypothetical protein
MLAYRKLKIALPIIGVLALARCGSGDGLGEQQQAGEASQQAKASQDARSDQRATGDGYTEAQIQAALEVLERADSGDASPGGKDGAQTQYSAEQIKAAMREHIERRTQLGKAGVFEITDPRTSQVLELEFHKIHDPVRVMKEGELYFACTNFGVVGQPDKTFDLDFWLQPHNGELEVYQENVHKVPQRRDGEWVQKAHYNFVDDRINLVE